MKLYNTGDSQVKPPVVMLVYGQGGVGKTTFSSTAPKPILMDCENGAKYFGLRGIKMDVAVIESWKDTEDFYRQVKDSDYDTVVIDPIGELMEKLKAYMVASRNAKHVMRDGTPTMAGWGFMKDKMRSFIKAIRDLGKHVVIIAHVTEKDDDGRMVKRPLIMTKISEELINIVDVVGWMTVVSNEEEEKRVIYIQPSDRYEAKDRTGQLGGVIEPNFSKIVDACQGNKTFAWSSEKAKKAQKQESEDGQTQSEQGQTTKKAPEKPQEPAKQPKTTKEPQEAVEADVEAAVGAAEADAEAEAMLNQALEA